MSQFDRVSASLQTALQYAHAEAVRLNSGLIATEHLLLGLSIDRANQAGIVLRLLGIRHGSIQEMVEHMTGQDEQPVEGKRKMTDYSMRALEEAVDTCNRFGSPEVTTLHLLIGITHQPTSTASKVLERLKVDPTDLHESLLRLYLPREGELATGPVLDRLTRTRLGALWYEFESRDTSGYAPPLHWHAQTLIVDAVLFANAAGQETAGTGHLLLALLGDAKTIPGRVLAGQGLNEKRLELAVRYAISPGIPGVSTRQNRLSPRLQEAIARAALEARLQRIPGSTLELASLAGRKPDRGSVNANHLLLGLLGVEQGIARTVLESYGLDPAGIRALTLAAMRRSGQDDQLLRGRPESLWEWMNEQLIRRQWSLADLAGASGISRRRLQEWVRGERRPSAASCDELAATFDVLPDTVRRLAGRPLLPVEPPAQALVSVGSPDAIEAMRSMFDRVRWSDDRIDRMTALLQRMLANDEDPATDSADS